MQKLLKKYNFSIFDETSIINYTFIVTCNLVDRIINMIHNKQCFRFVITFFLNITSTNLFFFNHANVQLVMLPRQLPFFLYIRNTAPPLVRFRHNPHVSIF